MADAEQKGWSAIDSMLDRWQSEEDESDNWVLEASVPLMYGMGMHKRRSEGIVHAGMAVAGALLEIDHLENGRWPESLDVVETRGLEYLPIDSLSEERLKYIVYPGEDSVAVYSVGINMVDDGGMMDRERGDLVLVLHSPGRS